MQNEKPEFHEILNQISELRNLVDQNYLKAHLSIETQIQASQNGLFIHAAKLPTEDTTHHAIAGLIPEEARMIIGGAPETGKTYLLYSLALALASGDPYLGHFKVSSPRSVLIVDQESGPKRLGGRLQRLAKGQGKDLNDYPIWVSSMNYLRFDKKEDIDRIMISAEEHQARVLLIDTLVRSHGSDESQAKDMSALFSNLDRMKSAIPIIIILAHIRKPPPGAFKDDTIFSIRGSGDIGAWVDCGYLTDHTRNSYKLECVKFRDGLRPEPFEFGIDDLDGGGVIVSYKGVFQKAIDLLEGHLKTTLDKMSDGQDWKISDLRTQTNIPKQSLNRAIGILLEDKKIVKVKRGVYHSAEFGLGFDAPLMAKEGVSDGPEDDAF